MTNSELREACEMAGLRYHSTPGPWYERDGWKWRASDPALPAYVASLLVDKVWNVHGLDYAIDAGHPDLCRVDFTSQPTADGVSYTERGTRRDWVECTIIAAMEVLRELGDTQC